MQCWLEPNRSAVAVAILSCAALFSPFGESLPEVAASDLPAAPPNVLLVFLDDFGWRDCGFMGSDFYETPHLDALAAGGMVFTDAYATAANCAPSRACLLSGQYTPRHKIFNVGTAPRGKAKHRRLEHIPGVDTLAPSIRTWAQQLQQAGYRTGTIGKWHLSKDPLPYGFDVNIGGTHSGSPPRGYYPPHGKVPGLEDAPPDEYLTDRLNQEAVKFIRDSADAPWMLYLTHFAVHTPLNAKRELVQKYAEKPPGELHDHVAMATMIEAVDEGIGQIVAVLRELGQLEQTAIFFTSDNGGYGPATDMAPLYGYKGTYYEGGIRVPFFVHWPEVVPAGTRCARPISNIDLYPTFCEITGAARPSGQALDGRSLLPLLTGAESEWPERALFWHFPAYLQSYRGADEQRDPLFRSRPCSIIRRGNWKLHEYFEDGGLELYNLATDPGEQRNRVASAPEVAERLHGELRRWRQEIDAVVPRRPNPRFDAAAEAKARAEAGRRAVQGKRPRKRSETSSGAP